jgi:hypothetical protein
VLSEAGLVRLQAAGVEVLDVEGLRSYDQL